MNLLQETIEILTRNNKTIDDVNFIFGNDFQITKKNFIDVANVDYDAGYGASEVAEDLILLGDDFFLERHEYDGSEWWEYKTISFKIPVEIVEVKRVTVPPHKVGWETLKECQEEQND